MRKDKNRGKKPAKRKNALRVVFVTQIFFLLLITSLIMAPVAYFFSQHGFEGRGPSMPIVLLLGLSVLLGTVLSGLVSNSILKPINKISDAFSAVAKGDFSVRLEAPPKVNELQDIFANFNLMVQELGSIETLRTDFVVNVSHEFKTPIAAIEGCATLLQDENATDAERREYTGMILDATKQLSTLTGNILKLSKLESSGVPIERQAFRLDEQLRQAVLLLEGEWSTKAIDMDVDLDAVQYAGNEELLLQVWLNLLANAVKFSRQGGRIGVRLFTTSQGLSVQVQDNGVGMAESVQRHAFEKFYQGDTARRASGNGLGLALAQRIVEEHGGSIGVKSKEGKGTTFTVRLPV